MTDETESESDIERDYYNVEFSCIKCGYDYNNYMESEYGFCKMCGNGRCKSCKSLCDECKEESCFRCVTYLECCDKFTCCTHFYCQECFSDVCVSCNGEEITCNDCEYNICKNCKSREHKNTYCSECAGNHCIYCNSFPDYNDTCEECVENIKDILEEVIPDIPTDVIDLILNITFDIK